LQLNANYIFSAQKHKEMSSELHVVLGASGASGRAVVQELKRRNLPFRAIGRSAHFSDFETTPYETGFREMAASFQTGQSV